MFWKLSVSGLALLFLSACASNSPAPVQILVQQNPIPPSLTELCPPLEHPSLRTNEDLVRSYLTALQWGSDCRARHKALADAVKRK